MKKLIHTALDDRGRLHCDNPACRYVLPEPLEWSVYLVDHPCPKCGSNMLTWRDFYKAEQIERRVVWINKWFGWLGTEEKPKGGVMVGVRPVNGKLHFTEEWLRDKIADEPDDASYEAGPSHPDMKDR